MVPLNWRPKADRFDVACGFRNRHHSRNLATTLSLSTDNTKRMDPQMDKLSAAGLVRAYRRRELSPVEVTQAVLQRIERLNPHYNAFCLVDADDFDRCRNAIDETQGSFFCQRSSDRIADRSAVFIP